LVDIIISIQRSYTDICITWLESDKNGENEKNWVETNDKEMSWEIQIGIWAQTRRKCNIFITPPPHPFPTPTPGPSPHPPQKIQQILIKWLKSKSFWSSFWCTGLSTHCYLSAPTISVCWNENNCPSCLTDSTLLDVARPTSEDRRKNFQKFLNNFRK
jgi:hypothetical protein